MTQHGINLLIATAVTVAMAYILLRRNYQEVKRNETPKGEWRQVGSQSGRWSSGRSIAPQRKYLKDDAEPRTVSRRVVEEKVPEKGPKKKTGIVDLIKYWDGLAPERRGELIIKHLKKEVRHPTWYDVGVIYRAEQLE